jgi:hydrogenase nickel incorporation protein HypA/HybF
VHELSITRSMFDLVMEQAKQAGATRIKGVNIIIGDMTGVVGDCISFYMELISKETIAEGAVLNIRNVQARAQCRDCKNEFEVKEMQWVCPSCGSLSIEITAGNELIVESIEID